MDKGNSKLLQGSDEILWWIDLREVFMNWERVLKTMKINVF